MAPPWTATVSFIYQHGFINIGIWLTNYYFNRKSTKNLEKLLGERIIHILYSCIRKNGTSHCDHVYLDIKILAILVDGNLNIFSSNYNSITASGYRVTYFQIVMV